MIKRYSFGYETLGDRYESEYEDKDGDWVRWKDAHAQSEVIKYLIARSVQTKESLLSNIYNILCEAFGEGHS